MTKIFVNKISTAWDCIEKHWREGRTRQMHFGGYRCITWVPTYRMHYRNSTIVLLVALYTHLYVPSMAWPHPQSWYGLATPSVSIWSGHTLSPEMAWPLPQSRNGLATPSVPIRPGHTLSPNRYKYNYSFHCCRKYKTGGFNNMLNKSMVFWWRSEGCKRCILGCLFRPEDRSFRVKLADIILAASCAWCINFTFGR